MVEYNIIKHADTQLANYFSTFTPVALFVGATNGIGKNSIKQFAKQTRGASTRPRVYFVGRSRERGEQLKEELLAINPNGVYEFVSADLTLLAEVDEVCRKIREKEKSLNLLFMTQGSFEPATETTENLPSRNAVVYYSKIRFAVNLAPLLQKAPVLRRSVMVFGSGFEGPIATNDFEGRTLSFMRSRDSTASMISLAVDKLSQEAPEVSWIHDHPGLVESGLWQGIQGLSGIMIRAVFSVLGRFVYTAPEACGERQMFMATSARFPPASSSKEAEKGFLPDDTKVGVVMSINGREGGGSYTVTDSGDAVAAKALDLLSGYIQDGTQDAVWKHTLETFQKITGYERF